MLLVLPVLLLTAAHVGGTNELDRGYRAMYNLQFDDAHKAFQTYQRLHPEDPFGPASDAAAYLFYEFERLKILRSEFFATNDSFFNQKKFKADADIKVRFEDALKKSRQLSTALAKNDPANARAQFANVVSTALHADYLALIEKQHWQALTEIKDARARAEALVTSHPEYKDAYLAVGVENYLLSQKAAPLRLFLRMTGAQTDKEDGLKKLRIVASEGDYLKPYAKILLAIAALRDGKKDEARRLMAELAKEFPQNDLFREELAKF